MSREQRRRPRVVVTERVRLHWKDRHGQLMSTMAETLDVSAQGLCVRLDHSIEVQTVVNLECRPLKLAGIAVVRHCLRTSVNHYTAGLQFAGGLEWRGATSLPT
jgi:hypothetical protein